MARAVDLADQTLWQNEDVVHDAFEQLRCHEPVSWQHEGSAPGVDPGPGYWAVVRHEDVVTVSTDPQRFSSASGTSIRTLPQALNEFLGSMLHMDDPRHAQLRRIVSRAFSARRLRVLTDQILTLADEHVRNLKADGGGDLVTRLAAPLPLSVICELMGIPVEDRPALGRHAETLGTSRDARAMLAAAHQLAECAGSLARARQADPRDDLVSALVQADVDGEQLSPAEIGSFFTLLVVAGAQTTRHAIGAGVVALAGAAAQRAHWVANGAAATPAAVEEILRWSTPARHFRRTATCATELGGKPIAAGDKVVVWYTSANRDESVFDDPRRRPRRPTGTNRSSTTLAASTSRERAIRTSPSVPALTFASALRSPATSSARSSTPFSGTRPTTSSPTPSASTHRSSPATSTCTASSECESDSPPHELDEYSLEGE